MFYDKAYKSRLCIEDEYWKNNKRWWFDDLIFLLKDKYAFKPIENDQVSNIFRSVIYWPKIKYLRCQWLLYSTNLYHNKRPDIDNLIVKVTFYDKIGNAIIRYCNVMVELKFIVNFIDNRKYNKGILFHDIAWKNVLFSLFILTKERIINIYWIDFK